MNSMPSLYGDSMSETKENDIEATKTMKSQAKMRAAKTNGLRVTSPRTPTNRKPTAMTPIGSSRRALNTGSGSMSDLLFLPHARVGAPNGLELSGAAHLHPT